MAMTERNKRVVLILVGIFAAGGVICIVCGVAGAFRITEWTQEVQRGAVVTTREADEFARTHDQIACRDEALRRSDTCAPTDITCRTQASVFSERCMQTAAQTPGMCDGVPPVLEIMPSAVWANAQCTQLGRRQDTWCTSLMQSVQRACERERR